MPLEEMREFFAARLDSYEDHMLQLAGAIYVEAAAHIPATPGLKLLDLGCGTGLELDEIFKVNPAVQVTGVDLTPGMLERLKAKYPGRQNQLHLIVADYFKYDFGVNVFNVVLSMQTLHHFTPEAKIGLYRKIHAALKPEGFYVESDYYAPDQAFEDFHFAESKRLRAEQGITDGFYHYDTPCTVENQIGLLKKAGFKTVNVFSRREKGAILVAGK
jgi:tRNA (cmo5U34)-methyltransferase